MEVTLIIPVFNCLSLTQACVAAVEATLGTRGEWEGIIVDDASTDDTPAWLATLSAPRWRVVTQPANRGYAAANNAAATQARGRFLVLLNNDTVPRPGWLEQMIEVHAAAPAAGIVGNVQFEARTGRLDHAGVMFDSEGRPFHVGKAAKRAPRGDWAEWPAVTAACCLMERTLFERLGGFDEAFRNGCEDVDICLRASEAGRRHYVAHRSVVLHHVSSSPGRRDHDAANLALLLDRWQDRVRERAKAWPSSWRRAEHLEKERVLREHHRDDGWRYLRKHALRPWRYNWTRLVTALRGVSERPDAAVPAAQNGDLQVR